MIIKSIDDNAVAVMPEDSDDLLNLRRIIQSGDRVAGDTTRVIKQDRDYSRPDKGERIHVRISMEVEKISLDGVLDRLRIQGTIAESSHEAVPHGSHHSLVVRTGQGITVSKNRWLPVQRRLLKSGRDQTGFVLVAIDTGDCGIARLKGTHLEFIPNMYSGAGGKRYKTGFRLEVFLEQVRQAVASTLRKGDVVVIFGPGETKRRLANFKGMAGYDIRMAEGIDSGGEDGIYIFTRSQAMREIMSGNKLARAASLIDDVMVMVSKKSRKFAMGFDEAVTANQMGAVESLVFSDRAIQDNDEQSMINLLNDAEGKGVNVYSVDSSTDVGLRVSNMGGIVAILRYVV